MDIILGNWFIAEILSFQVHNLLLKASENRAVAETKCNERSSRSHSVFRLRITGHNTCTDERCTGELGGCLNGRNQGRKGSISRIFWYMDYYAISCKNPHWRTSAAVVMLDGNIFVFHTCDIYFRKHENIFAFLTCEECKYIFMFPEINFPWQGLIYHVNIPQASWTWLIWLAASDWKNPGHKEHDSRRHRASTKA